MFRVGQDLKKKVWDILDAHECVISYMTTDNQYQIIYVGRNKINIIIYNLI